MAKTCAICKRSISAFECFFRGRAKIKDGFVCKDCILKTGKDTLPGAPEYTAKQVLSLINGKWEGPDFCNPNHIILPNQQFCFDQSCKKLLICGNIYDFKDLYSFETRENNNTIHQSGIKHAVAGGVLFGPAGAVVGAIAGHGSHDVCSLLAITITLTPIQPKKVTLVFLSREVAVESEDYRKAKSKMNYAIFILQRIVDDNIAKGIIKLNQSTSNGESIQPISKADEIRKFKDLFDEGAITQDEFDAMKKQVLGL